ncbi:MAG: class I SAM-dependent methyltransferase [Clostridia bacterium]|nr:class I SAM-dependent methyltransferase [Clostridia bacterium]
MPDHYFTDDPASEHRPHSLALRCGDRLLDCCTDAGVFSRGRVDPGTALLLEAIYKAMPDGFAGRALDLGCGWGAVGLSLACRYPNAELVLCDLNRRALALAEQSLARNGLRAQCVWSDGLADVRGTFALIAVNPPIRAGKATVYRLFDESRERLEPGGALFVVIRKQQGAPSALQRLREGFSAAEVVMRGGGYWVIRAVKSEE